MKGAYHIIVQNRNLKYEFDIRRNLTIIQGDSATGKTTLIDLIREYHMDKKSGINISCDRPCRVLEGDLWREQIQFINDSILFIDEGASFVESEEFASAARKSTNYFVIVTRSNLEMLPISVEEVYGIKSSGKYGTLEPVYHEMYRIYSQDTNDKNKSSSITLHKMPSEIDVSQMTSDQIRSKLQSSYEEYKEGKTLDAVEAFSRIKIKT